MSGGGTGTSKQQLQQQNALQQQAFNQMLNIQQQVSGAVSPYLSGNVGYNPQQLALLKSQFLNQNAAAYNQANANTKTQLLRSGSLNSAVPTGGDATRGIASLQAAEANNASSGIANINLQNLQQALNNQFNAASLINGQAAQLTSPINTFGQGANSALSNYVYASNQGLGASIARGLGGGLGVGLGSGLIGGLGGLLSGSGFGSGFGSATGGKG